MAKQMKLHIGNDKKQFVCGLIIKDHIKQAYWDDEVNQLYDYKGDLIDHTNMNCVCTNCMKLFHPSYLNDLLNEKTIADFKAALPKTNRQRARINAKKRLNRSKAKALSNVIYLDYKPLPKKAIALIEDKEWRSMNKKAKVIKPSKKQLKAKPIEEKPIELTEIVSIDTDADCIDFGDGVAIIKGLNNDWMVVVNTDGKTESLTSWIPYKDAFNEANQLVNAA